MVFVQKENERKCGGGDERSEAQGWSRVVLWPVGLFFTVLYPKCVVSCRVNFMHFKFKLNII